MSGGGYIIKVGEPHKILKNFLKIQEDFSHSAAIVLEVKMTNDVRPRFLSDVREQLRYWPYTLHQIEDTLDIGLIEGKAKQILFQSLNAQTLCGFAGSGLSAAYGRLSWGEWKDEQLSVVEHNAQAFLDLAVASHKWLELLVSTVHAIDGSPKRPENTWAADVYDRMDPGKSCGANRGRQKARHNVWRWLGGRLRAVDYAENEIRQLFDTFKKANSDHGTFPGGEALPIQFEIAQHLHDQIRRHLSLFSAIDVGDGSGELPVPSENILGKVFWAGANQSDKTAAPRASLLTLKAAVRDAGKQLPDPCHKIEKDYREKWNAFNDVSSLRASRLSFETLTKVLLVDECGHASVLLRNGLVRKDIESNKTKLLKLETELNIFDVTKLKRDLDGIRGKPDRYKVLSPFHKTAVDTLLDKVKGEEAATLWKYLLETTKIKLDKYFKDSESQGDPRLFLTPTSRFLVGACLRLFRDPFDSLQPMPGVDPVQNNKGLCIFDDLKATDFTSRRSIIADRFDPLAKVIRDLGINRFITTNYDFEIERFFQDAGFRLSDPENLEQKDAPGQENQAKGGDFRHDPLGNTLADRTFERDRAAELVSFSMNRKQNSSAVFHLHGRATRDESLVISERDYMELYLTEDRNRDSVDEAISVAFSSAPVLFLGLGMTEADMLRPLRQFISNRDRTAGYNSIALLPAEKSHDERVKVSTALYLRYGVHTIFYGSGQVVVKDADDNEKLCGIDWLHRILALRGEMEKQVDEWIKALELAEKGKWPTLEKGWKVAFLKRLDEKSGDLGEDLKEPGVFPANTRALNVMMGIPGEKFDAEAMLGKLKKDQDDRPSVFVDPTFTPIRPKVADSNNRHHDDSVHVEGKTYTGFYMHLLEQILWIMVEDPFSARHSKQPSESDRECRKKNLLAAQDDLAARKLLLSGLYGAFLGASLNANLDGLTREWRLWWKNWQESPPARSAVFESVDAAGIGEQEIKVAKQEHKRREAFLMPVRRIRHRVDNSITDLSSAENTTCPPTLGLNKEFKLVPGFRTNIRAFDTFVAAVAAQWLPPAYKGADLRDIGDTSKRRFYTVAALRGHGKGMFMNAMISRIGFSLYVRAAWPENGIRVEDGTGFTAKEWNKPGVVFPTAIFINYTFSSEIASTFDMMVGAIVDATARVNALFDHWDNIPERVRDRVYQATMEDAQPKKSAQNSLAVWKSPLVVWKGSLVDWTISLAGWHKLIANFKKVRETAGQHAKESANVFAGLSRHGQLVGALEAFQHASNAFVNLKHPKNKHDRPTKQGVQPRLLVCINAAELLYRPDGRCKNDEIARFIGVLTGSQSKDMPLDLVILGSEQGLGTPWSNVEGKSHEAVAQLKLARIDRKHLPMNANEHVERRISAGRIKVSKNSEKKDRDGFVHFARPVSPMEMMISNFPTLAKALFLLNPPEGHVGLQSNDWEKKFPKLNDALKNARKNERVAIVNAWAEVEIPSPTKLQEVRNEARKVLDSQLDIHVKDMGEEANLTCHNPDPIREYLRGRYKMDDNPDAKEWHNIRQYLSGNRFCLTILLAAAQHIVEHATDLKSGAQDAEKFIHSTVDQVRNVGDSRKEDLVLSTVLDCYRRYQVTGRADADMYLHLLLLRHLAVIGTPVTAGVIVRLPEFREYFARLKEEPEVSRRRIVVFALSVLCQRGLVFRLSPHPLLVQRKTDKGHHWPPELDFRFALHRVVQRHSMSLLGQGRTDPVRSNPFAPTLFGSMTSGGPRLSREAYVFLRRLMVGLSQYPDMSQAEGGLEPWLFTTEDTEISVQALRASLSLARASFSVATISRFADYRRLIPGSERRGYLETYKVQLRWIIRKAWELNKKVKTGSEPAQRNNPKFNALYRDEVVWLYNELGVTSLAQGSLSDALALLRQAAEFNANIEGRDLNGPMSNMISLNHAIVQLERGRLISARNRLNTVENATREHPGTVHHLAKGYLCVLDHLTGRTQGLSKRFEHASDFFQEAGEKRAASILLHHWARFLLESDPDKARQLLVTARRLAETGGHEDIRHHIQIAEILVGEKLHGEAGSAGHETYSQVRAIERFGRHMGIWSLQCDSLILNARLLTEQGETSKAGQLLARALAISHRFSMNLRRNRALTIYADLLRRRGDKHGAESIAVASLELAKTTGFSLETVRAQKVLSEIGTTSV